MPSPTPPPKPVKSTPDPRKEFNEYLPKVTQDLDEITTHAAALPQGSDLAFLRTLNKKMKFDIIDASEAILKMTTDLLDLISTPDAKKRVKLQDQDDVIDGYKRGVVGSVDGLLEDADSALDEITGKKRKAAIAIAPTASATDKLPGPRGSVHDMFSSAAITLPRPQKHFPDTVNNFDTQPFTPNLPYKHHAMVPLDHHPILDYRLLPDPVSSRDQLAEEKSKLQHPYYYETKHLPYPSSMFTSSPPIVPPPIEKTTPEWVDTPEALAEMTEELKSVKEIAVDLEHHDWYSFAGFTCLIQISTRDKDYLIDTLKLRGALREEKLGGVFADPSIIKVFHGAQQDVVWLQRDFDIYIVNLFDTFEACKVLDLPQKNLKYLLETYAQYQTDKSLQLADWRLRPLTPAMRTYAQADTHFLLYIYDQMRNAILDKSRASTPLSETGDVTSANPESNPQRAMREVLEHSADTALQLFKKDIYDIQSKNVARSFKNWRLKHAPDLDPKSCNAAMLLALHQYRNMIARTDDVGLFTAMPASLIMPIFYAFPRGLAKFTAFVSKYRHLKDRAQELYNTLEAARNEWSAKYDIAEMEDEAQPIVPRQVAKAKAASLKASPSTSEGPTKEGVSSAAEVSENVDDPSSSVSKPVDEAPAWSSDIWDTIDDFAEPASTSTEAESSLFGKSLSSKKKSASTKSNSQTRGAISSLFGSTIEPKSQKTSAAEADESFAEVQQSIIADIAPAKPAAEPVTLESVPGGNKLPEPETVPFVPQAFRNTPASTPFVASMAKKEEEVKPSAAREDNSPSPEAVVVRKSKKTKKKNKVSKADSGESDTAPEPPQKKQKKAKVEKEVPTFDYSTAPNLLDNPEAVESTKRSRKKKKADKPKRVEVTGMTFGKATQDKSQPKSGNKSMTFNDK